MRTTLAWLYIYIGTPFLYRALIAMKKRARVLAEKRKQCVKVAVIAFIVGVLSFSAAVDISRPAKRGPAGGDQYRVRRSATPAYPQQLVPDPGPAGTEKCTHVTCSRLSRFAFGVCVWDGRPHCGRFVVVWLPLAAAADRYRSDLYIYRFNFISRDLAIFNACFCYKHSPGVFFSLGAIVRRRDQLPLCLGWDRWRAQVCGECFANFKPNGSNSFCANPRIFSMSAHLRDVKYDEIRPASYIIICAGIHLKLSVKKCRAYCGLCQRGYF